MWCACRRRRGGFQLSHMVRCGLCLACLCGMLVLVRELFEGVAMSTKDLVGWDGLRFETDFFLNHLIDYREDMRKRYPDSRSEIDYRFEQLSLEVDTIVDLLGEIG